MRAKITLYTRFGTDYQRVEFKNGKPNLPKNYDGQFYLRYVAEKGRRKYDAFGSLDAALAQRQILTDNLERKREGLAPLPAVAARPAKRSGAPTIAEAVAEFVAYSTSRVNGWRNGDANGLAPNSLVAYRKAVESFGASCAQMGATLISELQNPERGKEILLHFKKWLQANVDRRSGKGAYSDARKFTVINAFLARNRIKMVKDRTFNPDDPGLLDRKDVPRVKKPGIGDVVFYTPADIKAMLAAAESVHDKSIYLADDLKDLILIFVRTGMRDEEIQHLTWEDINWKNGDGKGKITIQDKPKYDWRVKDHEKRIVTMHDKLRTRLKAREEGKGERSPRNGSELLFPTSEGTLNQNFADHITALQKRAEEGQGQKNGKPYVFSRPEARIHPLHNFRKTYATMAMVSGVTPRNIQRDLGHSDLSTTERYLALVDEPDKIKREFETIG
jgi:integrase